MRTNFPTVELYFCYAFTFCKIRVYEAEEQFARQLLDTCPGVELLNPLDSDSWHEIDTRMLVALVRQVFVRNNHLTRLKKAAR